MMAPDRVEKESAAEESDAALVAIGAEVLRVAALALLCMSDAVPTGFAAAVRLIQRARGRVVVTGMGKSGHVARKIASTLASTGTPALFVHPGEASHGDLGMIADDDVCLLLSNSGETPELRDLVGYTRRFAVPLIAITTNAASTYARSADVALTLPELREACPLGIVPTTSTTCALALGDALAVALLTERGFTRDAFHVFHPGGKLGAQFLRVEEIMHRGDRLPIVPPEAPMGEVLVEMSRQGFGIAAVTTAGRLTGAITDGDLRRNLVGLMDRCAGDVATPKPRTASPDMLVSEALGLMNRQKIAALFVVDGAGALCGLVHIHDCLRVGVV